MRTPRPGTRAATKAADRDTHAAWYAWQRAILAHGENSDQAAAALAAYETAALARGAAATAMHNRSGEDPQ